MKRSPFENPYVLADQIGNWLTGWKTASAQKDYTKAPKLRNISKGEQIFRTRCITCHSLTGSELAGSLGPDLLDVTNRRDKQWLFDWLKAPDKMLEKKDPIALALYQKYNNLIMPNMRLNQQEAQTIFDYINDETIRLNRSSKNNNKPTSYKQTPTKKTVDIIDITNSWIRESDTSATINAGYMTLNNQGNEAVTLIKIESKLFNTVEIHEMTNIDGLMEMREIMYPVIPAHGTMLLEPGGKHLMLKKPRKHLIKGQKIDLTLTFKSGKKQIVSIDVAAR